MNFTQFWVFINDWIFPELRQDKSIYSAMNNLNARHLLMYWKKIFVFKSKYNKLKMIVCLTLSKIVNKHLTKRDSKCDRSFYYIYYTSIALGIFFWTINSGREIHIFKEKFSQHLYWKKVIYFFVGSRNETCRLRVLAPMFSRNCLPGT